MDTNIETQQELLKEVLGRAKKEERQEYDSIVERQNAIGERMREIGLEIDVLVERSKQNEFPKRKDGGFHAPDKTHDEIMGMSSGELHEWCQQIIRETAEYNVESRRWNDGFEVWSAKNTVILNERMKLVDESEELGNEFFSLEDKEKWLLLSIALRSQPNLLKYM